MFLFFLFADKTNAQLNISPVTSPYPGGYNITCHGATDGWIDILVEGGTPPYWFYWSNGSFNQNLDNLTAGSYTVVVSDMNNLVDSITVILYEPNQIDIQLEPRVYEGGYNISEAGQSNGKIECHVSGGVQDYSYLWNTNSTEYKIEDIPAGNYSVRVTDMNDCFSTASITLIEPSPLHIISLTSPLHHGYNLSCKNSEDGAINITVAGGSGPYTFHWFNSSYSIGVQNPTGLKAGHYSVIVTDVNDISIGGQITLTEPIEFLVLSITPSVYPPQNKNLSCSTCSNGSLTANLTGGIGNKKYQWVDQSTNQSIGQTTQTASNLSAGTYLVTVTDTNGCIATGTHSIIAPDRDDWSMTGNSNILSSEYLGTADNKDLVFKTNGTERFRITGSGGLKLNSLSGSSTNLLSVDNSGNLARSGLLEYRAATTGHPAVLSFNGPPIPTNSLPDFCSMPQNDPTAFQFNGSLQSWGTSASGGNVNILSMGFDTQNGIIDILGTNTGIPPRLLIDFYCGADVYVGNSNAGDLTANKNLFVGNNLGIGTRLPTQKFEVAHNDGNGTPGGMALNNTSASNYNSEIKFMGNSQGSSINLWSIGCDVTHDKSQNFFIYDNTASSNNLRFMIDGSGRVGINTVPPANGLYKLYVEGSIAAREIKVTAGNFPDYVFHKGFSLMTIYDLKKFIQENEHLPDVPTEKEVSTANGFEVGKFQTMLLKKIEEQTLYIISLQEQIDAIKAELTNKVK